MNSKTGLFTAAWAVSCGAAFLIGRTTSSPGEEENAMDKKRDAPALSSRGSSRSMGSGSSSRSPGTPRGPAETGPSSQAQLDAIRLEIRDLKEMSDPIARAEAFLSFVKSLGPGEFLDAVDAYREGGIENEQFGEYRMLLTAWAETDPLEALAYATEKTGTPFARQTILGTWAKNDTEGAIAWARENFDNKGDEKRANPWLVGVIEGISSTNLSRATELMEELPFSRERGEALDAVFAEVTNGGTESAKQWVAQLSDDRLKEGAASRLAGLLAKDSPQEAAEWAASMGPEIMKRSAGDIVSRWADSDITGARQWVEEQPDKVMAAAAPNLVQKMIQKEDVATAANWLSSHEGDPAFDDSVRSLVWHSMGDEPTTAASWIMKLTSERDQERTFHRVLGGWMSRDRDAAMDYINNNPVPESIKRRAQMTRDDN